LSAEGRESSHRSLFASHRPHMDGIVTIDANRIVCSPIDLHCPTVALRSCSVSFVAASGVRHRVDVLAESLYEAGVLAIALLRKDGWAEQIAPGTQLEIQVREPATTHCVTITQLRRWVEGIAVSPDDTLKKRRLRSLLLVALEVGNHFLC
jgi:hypothetical protein